MKKTVPPLTEVELEILSYVWELGECSVHHILEEMPSNRPLAYNSVSTMVRALEKKGYVKATKRGRTHYYSPLIGKDEIAKNKLKQLLSRLFQGNPIELVRTLVNTSELSEDDIDEIEDLLKGMKKK